MYINDPEFAAALAYRLHAGQKYGDADYYTGHLQKVVNVIAAFRPSGSEIVAAWLHDSIEDTEMTALVLGSLFSPKVADLVDAVTGVGSNRKERNKSIYSKIGAYPAAARIKVADRIANLEASSTSHKSMYIKEKDEFFDRVAVHVSTEMKRRLAQAYE